MAEPNSLPSLKQYEQFISIIRSRPQYLSRVVRHLSLEDVSSLL